MATAEREYNLSIAEEDGMLWAEVVELPGTFASGEDMDELIAAAIEAIEMVEPPPQASERSFRPSPPMTKARVSEAKVAFA